MARSITPSAAFSSSPPVRPTDTCRRDFLRTVAGGMAAALCGAKSLAAPQNIQLWQRWVDAGWKALQKDNDPSTAVECFLRAREYGQLREWEYHALARALSSLDGRAKQAVDVAEEGYRVWRSADARGTRAMSLFDAGLPAKALDDLRQAMHMPGADPKAGGPLLHAFDYLASLRIEFSVCLDYADFHPAGQRLYRHNGYYTCYLPRSEPWQQVTVLGTTGAQRIEEWRDENDNRALKIWTKSDAEVETRIQVVRSPWFVMPPPGTGPYELPPDVAKYMGKTQNCDPTSEMVRRVAEPLRGATRLETVRNVKAWTDEHIAGLDKGPASGPRHPGRSEVDAMLLDASETGLGCSNCGFTTHLRSALLRRLGIASTGKFHKGFASDTPSISNAGHVWACYYEPGVGWLSLMEGGVRIGEWPPGWVAFCLGDSNALASTEWSDSGMYWWYSSNGQTKEVYRPRSVARVAEW